MFHRDADPSQMVDAKDTSSPKTDKHFADNNQKGKVMYIQQPKDMYSACFGGLMGTRAQYLGAAGVVIDGQFRDVLEIQEMHLPVRTESPPSSSPSASDFPND